MTAAGKVLCFVYGLALVGAVSAGGQFLGAARWLYAAAAYTAAGICLLGLLREVGRAIPPGDYTDDDQEPVMVGDTYVPGQPQPRRMGRVRAARAARRELRNRPCGCERYWTSAGTAHDPYCPKHDQAAA